MSEARLKDIFDGDACHWDLVPPHLRRGLREYAETGRPTGAFLDAVLCDLPFSVVVPRADDASFAGLRGLISFLHLELPADAWGSAHRVAQWKAAGGARGLARQGARPTGEAGR